MSDREKRGKALHDHLIKLQALVMLPRESPLILSTCSLFRAQHAS